MNIFEVFLPQLLLYPNASDPLNGEAAALLMREPEQYAIRVKGTQRAAVGHARSGMRGTPATLVLARDLALDARPQIGPTEPQIGPGEPKLNPILDP